MKEVFHSNTIELKLAKEMYPYFKSSYDTKERFCSYWHQLDEVITLRPKEVLEIGIGNSFLTRYFKEKDLKITTLDIEHELRPDVAGSVLFLPFTNSSFELVTCYEVLEHLPYEDFCKALNELGRVSQSNVVISLPDASTIYRVNIELPRFKPIKKLIPHPFPRSTPHVYDGEHYWEIGKSQYPLKKILQDIHRSGLNVVKTYRVFEFYYHRFFLLTKS